MWDKAIYETYQNDFRVVKTNLKVTDKYRLCRDEQCYFFNGHWVNENGSWDPRIVVFFDSQGRKVVEKWGDYLFPDSSRGISISGGGLCDVKDLMDKRYVKHAETIVIAGVGTNDLCKRAAPANTPPAVKGIAAAKPKFVLDYDKGDSSCDQVPKYGAEDLTRFLSEIANKLQPSQTLLTFDPFVRRTGGFCNRQIALFNSKLDPLTPTHHHVKTLNAFTASNAHRRRKANGGDDVFGGRRPIQDLFFEPGNIHLNGHALDLFMKSLSRALFVLRDVRRGEPMPKKGEKVIDEKGFTWRF